MSFFDKIDSQIQTFGINIIFNRYISVYLFKIHPNFSK
jgi:hypothetical protein